MRPYMLTLASEVSIRWMSGRRGGREGRKKKEKEEKAGNSKQQTATQPRDMYIQDH